jgi:hypothetical protein
MEQKTKDNLIYLSVAGAVGGALTFYIFYADRTLGRIPDISGPILWSVLSTPVIVALLVAQFWVHRRRLWLWVLSFVAGSVNVVAMFVAHRFGWNPPVIVWSATTGFWVMVVFFVAGKFANEDRSG